MDPHRSSYPEDPEPRWFGGEQYADPEWDGRYEPRFGDENYPAPEPRGSAPGDRYADARHAEPGRVPGSGPPPHGPGASHGPGGTGPGAPLGPGPHVPGPVGPRSGEPLPPLPSDPTMTRETPPIEAGRYQAETHDRAALRRPAKGFSDGIYRARRPAVAALVGTVALALAVPVLLLLIDSVGSPVSAAGVIAGVLALVGLPLAALGMYALVTGAARVPESPPTHAWLRPPLAYLAVALVLFVAAGLAAS